MLIGREEDAFDSPDYVYELKLDGDHCVAYLDPGHGTDLVNKRGKSIVSHFPELAYLHRQVSQRCILDGELIVDSGQKHEFEFIRSRLSTTNKYSIRRLSQKTPANFVAFDILYEKTGPVMGLPLMERKAILGRGVGEGDGLVISRYIENQGVALYRLVEERGLEGVVAKRKDSTYIMGKRSKDWVKFKNWVDDDFVICGYYPSDKANVFSLVLGQYRRDGDAPGSWSIKAT